MSGLLALCEVLKSNSSLRELEYAALRLYLATPLMRPAIKRQQPMTHHVDSHPACFATPLTKRVPMPS